MKSIKQYATMYDRAPGNNFAKACYNDNSLYELQEPHAPENADVYDCKEWGISKEEWSDAIEAALQEKLCKIIENFADGPTLYKIEQLFDAGLAKLIDTAYEGTCQLIEIGDKKWVVLADKFSVISHDEDIASSTWRDPIFPK